MSNKLLSLKDGRSFSSRKDKNRCLIKLSNEFISKLTLGYVSTGISKRNILLTVNELGLAGALCQSIVIPGGPHNLCFLQRKQ